MTEIEIYTTKSCPYCRRAKDLLVRKSLSFKEISVDGEPRLRAELAERTGRTSVPQIFFGDRHIGGCDDLYDLDGEGKIEELLVERPQ